MRNAGLSRESPILVVTLYDYDEPIDLAVTNRLAVSRVQKWLDDIKPTQPPPEQLGDVQPWCIVRFIQSSWGNDAWNPKTVWVYRTRDSTGFQLLSRKQRAQLLHILHVKEPLKGGKNFAPIPSDAEN
jgi:hypothetical protein